MKAKLILTLVLVLFINDSKLLAQEQITMLNFFQAGAVPSTISSRGKNFSTTGLSFNFVRFTEPKFVRFDATWLVRYLLNGTKDTNNFKDSNKIMGMDLPIFNLTYGLNFIKNDKFSLGLGVNIDSRTLYSSPQQKAKGLMDAVNAGIVTGIKVKVRDWLTYTTLAGYDYMFINGKNEKSDGTQIYTQNNFSFLLKGKFGINTQLDFSFKSFDYDGFHGGKIFNKNIKLGLVYAIP